MPRHWHDEDGAALLTVMGVTTLVLLLATLAFQTAITAQRQAYDFAASNAALTTAEAGLDDYVARLNRIPGYFANFDEANPGDNAALDGWASVPRSDGEYHIDIDASTVTSDGAMLIRSTGRVHDQTRTIESVVRPAGFLDFIYFTNYEIVDPEVIGTDPDRCNRYFYEGRQDRECGRIRFVDGDRIRGPFHTNDAFVVDGDPVFEGEATTSYRGGDPAYTGCNDATNQLWRDQNGTSNPTFDGGLCWSEILDVPEDNQTIQNQTTHVSPSTMGCAYYGPTYIQFYDPNPAVNNDGRMRVRSPFSVTEPAGAIPKNDATCGSDAALASVNGADVPIPPNGVIYVDGNTDVSCTAATHPLGMPRWQDDTVYDCNAGDAFVWGTVDGQVTVAASNDILIVWDLVYAAPFPDTDDITGLVADEDVMLYHPVNLANPGSRGVGTNLPKFGRARGQNIPPFIPGHLPTAADPRHPDPQIHAAIMAVRHSFGVQNFQRGDPYPRSSGTLTVRGAIAQNYRGPVGTSSRGNKRTGYDKDYVYDERLRYLSPPFFVQPGGETTWRPRTWAEIVPPGDLPS